MVKMPHKKHSHDDAACEEKSKNLSLYSVKIVLHLLNSTKRGTASLTFCDFLSDSAAEGVNEQMTVVTPLLTREVTDGGNEQQTTSAV